MTSQRGGHLHLGCERSTGGELHRRRARRLPLQRRSATASSGPSAELSRPLRGRPERRLRRSSAETDSGGAVSAYYVHGLGLIERIDAYRRHAATTTSTTAEAPLRSPMSGSTSPTPTATTNLAAVKSIARDNGQPVRYLGDAGVGRRRRGLVFDRARYLAPALGRFLNKDPGSPSGDSKSQAFHAYVYGLNDPIGQLYRRRWGVLSLAITTHFPRGRRCGCGRKCSGVRRSE